MLITNLNSIIADSKIKEYDFSGIKFTIQRVKNDINGNPLYKISFKDNTIQEKLKSKIGKTYLSKGYTVFQSYNLASTIQSIFNIINSKEVK